MTVRVSGRRRIWSIISAGSFCAATLADCSTVLIADDRHMFGVA